MTAERVVGRRRLRRPPRPPSAPGSRPRPSARCARCSEGATASASQISSTSSRRCASLATPRMPRMLAEPLSVCAARLALRSSSVCAGCGDPAVSDWVTSAACGGESFMNASMQRGVHVTRDVECQVRGRERFGRGLFGLVERGADGAGRERARRAAPPAPRLPAAAAPSRRRNVRAAHSIGRRRVGVAQMRLEQRRPFGEERPHQHARIGVVRVEVVEVAEHAGADALDALEAHVARGFRKPRHGRYIGIVGARRAAVSLPAS